MDLSSVILIVRRRWWLVVMATALATLAGSWVATSDNTVYEARIRLLVGPINAPVDTVRAGGQLSATFSELVTSEQLLRSTIQSLNLPMSLEELRESIRPTADTATRIIVIRVRDTEPPRAVAVANELARQLTQLAGSATEGQVRTIDSATIPEPLGAATNLIIVVAGLAGLIVGLGLVLLMDHLNRRVGSEQDLVDLAGVPVLGAVPAQRRLLGGASGLVVETAPSSQRAAAFRLLATKIELLTKGPTRRILIIGTRGGYGSGELAANVGFVLADARRDALIVDANPVTAEVTDRLELEQRAGLTEMIDHATLHDEKELDLEPYLTQWSSGVLVLPIGQAHRRSAGARLDSSRIVHRIFQRTDCTIVDAAPVLRSPETLLWATAADACILVVQQNRTNLEEVRRTAQTLRLIGAQLIGTVLQEAPSVRSALTGATERGGDVVEDVGRVPAIMGTAGRRSPFASGGDRPAGPG